jgi:diketogulonate reductase-like aldo/keto reductase
MRLPTSRLCNVAAALGVFAKSQSFGSLPFILMTVGENVAHQSCADTPSPSSEENQECRAMRAADNSPSSNQENGAMHQSKMHLLYGTAWKKENTAQLVSDAVRNGFRFIDTACQPKHYNEPGVGKGWYEAAAELGLTRQDFYLQSKFTSISGQDPKRIPYDRTKSIEEQVKESLKVSLKNLRTDYLDALVLHGPEPTMASTMKAWRTMESFVEEGQVRLIGISNMYDFEDFQELYANAKVKPSILQNRFYAESNFDTEIRAFCKEKGILYQSFWTLTASRDALKTAEIRELADVKGLTPQTLMYAFMMTLGHTPLDGTTNVKHMQEDIEVESRIKAGEQIFADKAELQRMAQILGMPHL